MTKNELIEKMARAICCPNGCNFARQCDATTDLAQERQREASAALAVITEWLEGEAKQINYHINKPHSSQDFMSNIALSGEALTIRRLIATMKGETK